MKSKVAAKGGNTKYQWNILKMLGMNDEEVKRCFDILYIYTEWISNDLLNCSLSFCCVCILYFRDFSRK